MRKALIPLGIAAVIGVVGIVVSTVGGSGYVPATLTLEGAGGTDAEVKDLETFDKVLSSEGLNRGSAYYSALIGAKEDPEPLKEGNSFGAIAIGGTQVRQGSNSQTLERTLTIAQNEKGCIYHIDAVVDARADGESSHLDQDLLFAVSRHGMFIKYNNYEQTNSDKESQKTLDVMNKGVKNHRGNWYELSLSEAHQKEAEKGPGTSIDSMAHYMALYTCAMTAASWSSEMLSALDGNAQFFTMCSEIITAYGEEMSKSGNVWTYEQPKYATTYKFDLNTPNEPKIHAVQDYSQSGVTQKQTQDISFYHLDNCKVEIVESGAGDMYDLLGSAFEELYREQAKSAMGA